MVKCACKRIMLILATLWYWVLTTVGDLKHPNNINNVVNLQNHITVGWFRFVPVLSNS